MPLSDEGGSFPAARSLLLPPNQNQTATGITINVLKRTLISQL
jgi:hypothetical protein